MTVIYQGHTTTEANADLDAMVASVSAEVAARSVAIAAEATARTAAVTAEATARSAADALLLPLAGGVMTGGLHTPQVDIDTGGQGVVLLTPDLTKRYGVRIDNTGALSTTLLGAANGAPLPAAFVTSAGNASSTGTSATSAAVDTTGATLIVVAVHDDYVNPSSLAVTDSKGNIYVRLSFAGFHTRTNLFYCVNPVVGAGHTVTSTDALAALQTVQFAAFSGDFAAAAFDLEGPGAVDFSAASVAIAPGSVAPSQGSELVISAMSYHSAGTIAVGSGFTITNQGSGASNIGGALAWKVSSTAENPAWSWTGASDKGSAAAIATFKLAPRVVAPVPIQFGLELHLDMDREPSRPDAGVVKSVTNRAPTAHTISQPGATFPAYRRVNGHGELYFPTAGGTLPVQFATAQSTTERTVFIVARGSGSLTNDQMLYHLGPDDASATAQQAFVAHLALGQFYLAQGAPYLTGFTATAAETALCFAGSASGAALPEGIGMWGWLNGGRRSFRQQHANNSGWQTFAGLTSGVIGGLASGQGTYRYEGGIRCILDYSRRLTDAEVAQTFAYLRTVYGTVASTVELLNVVADGDSITAGFMGASNAPALIDQLALTLPATTRIYNLGVLGQTTAQMLADASFQVYPLYNAAIAKNILQHFGGTNDIGGGATPASVYANIVNECSAAQAAGYKVIVLTTLPRGTDPTFETNRQSLDTLIRANWHSFANAIADIGADATIGVAGAQNNTTYYQGDKIHLTSAGSLVIVNYLTPLILGL